MFFKKILDYSKGLNIKVSDYLIYVEIGEQKLYLFFNNELIREYRVSTSRAECSCVEGSLGTPCGLHKIDGKVGDGEPLETVFRGRVPCGLVSQQSQEEQSKNLITTRILRLRGLEDGVNAGGNVDTYNRYVYIHGTNQEDKIGQRNSHGCVLLNNKDMLELFDIVKNNTIVLIDK